MSDPPRPDSVDFDVLARPSGGPPPESVSPDAFFTEPPPAEPDVPFAERVARRPLAFGGLLAGIGFLGTLVFAANLLHQIVVGAPVFEELLKFGLALVLVAALKVEWAPARLLVALVPGVAFGVFEHYVTYPDEPLALLVDRILFHSGATALSMSMYTALQPVWDVRTRWLATIPATVVHWANNFLAVFLGVGSLVVGVLETVMIGIAFGLAALTHVLAWTVLAKEPRVRLLVAREWFRRAPPAGGRRAGGFTDRHRVPTDLAGAPAPVRAAASGTREAPGPREESPEDGPP